MPKLTRSRIAGIVAAVAAWVRDVWQNGTGPRGGRMIPIRVEATARRVPRR